MNVIIFGPSSPVGKELIPQALERGHRVTAFARDPERLQPRDPRLAIVRGDVLDGASLRAALSGQEAAFSALGIRRGAVGLLLAEGIDNLVQALSQADIRRFIYLSPVNQGNANPAPGRLRQMFLHRHISRAALVEQAVIERYIRSSSLDWTIVQPAGKSSFSAIAKFMLDELENPRRLCEAAYID